MNNFEFCATTKVVFGKGAETKLGKELKELGWKRTLIHYGGGSIVCSGLLDRIKGYLDEVGIEYVELGGVRANPYVGLVRKGIELCIRENVDSVLAVGGGSVIDSAKAISVGAMHTERDVWDFYQRKAVPEKHLPVATVLTISAAGSETSSHAILTDEQSMIKRGLAGEFYRPIVAFLNPELTYTLPSYQIACGVVDIIMHTLERYFSPDQDNELTDQISEGLLRTMLIYGVRYVKSPSDYTAASEVMWAGSLSHNDITGLGRTPDWAAHQFGHELSASFDVAHGASLAAIWQFWARYAYRANPGRFARLAKSLWGTEAAGANDEDTALVGIERMTTYFVAMGLAVDIPSLLGRELRYDELDKLSERITFFHTRTIGNFLKMGYEDIRQVLKAANLMSNG